MSIDVCVCTFQRPSIQDTLRSLAAQDISNEATLRVIVADNAETAVAQADIKEAGQALGLDILYLHAPARNISVARNACLDTATAPLIAFIDDDEIADQAWLRVLRATLEASGAGVVFGPVVALYRHEAPAWLREANLHSTRPVVRTHGHIDTGYTSNVMMRREVIGNERFLLELGQSGGEDVIFFHRLYARGISLEFAPEAVVYESVPEAREKMGWLLRRSFRAGQSHGRMLAEQSERRVGPAIFAAAKSAYYLAGTVLRMTSPPGWRRNLTRVAMHAGVTGYLLGLRELQLYKS